MNFYEEYKDEIKAFFDALIEFIKVLIAKLTEGKDDTTAEQ